MRCRLVGLLLGAAALCGCADAVPPRQPVPTPTPPTTASPGHADPGYGICGRLGLPELVRSIGEPGRVREEPGDLDVVHRICRLWVGPGDHRAGARITIEIVIGGPFNARLGPGNPLGMVRTVEPISGWWSHGNRAVSRDITRPPDATRILVDTVIEHHDLWVHVWVRNPRVEGDAEWLATTLLGGKVLTRLRDQLTLQPTSAPLEPSEAAGP